MSEPSLFNERSFDPLLSSVEQLRRRFVADWEDSLTNGSVPPELQKYLGELPEPERSQARAELEAVEQSYRQRLASNQTVDAAHFPGETVPDPARVEQGTVDYARPVPPADPETLSAEADPAETGAFSLDESAAEVVRDTDHPAESAASTVDYRRGETGGKRARAADTERQSGARSKSAGGVRRGWPATRS